MFDVITIGAATRDVFLISKNFEIIRSPRSHTGAYECVTLGSKIEVEKMVLTSGGGATNAAATFAAFGFRTAVIARIGDDLPGQGLIAELKQKQINTDLIRVIKREATAYSTILTAPSGERTILVHRGVSANFNNADIPWSKLKTKILYITSLGENLAFVKKIIDFAHKNNIKVALNPGLGEIKKGARAFAPIMPKLSALILNREEANTLVGGKTTGIKSMLDQLGLRCPLVVITDGERGAYTRCHHETYFAKPTTVKVISRTGAGDAFGAGFIASLMKDDDVARALAIGILNAQSVVGKIGAKIGILKKFPDKKEQKKIKVMVV